MAQTDNSRESSDLRSSASMSRNLLDQLKQNDSYAWNHLVELYAPLVFYWCRQLGVPEQDNIDIFQEVFHSLSKNINQFRRERPSDTFRGWLRTITRNKVYDHYRKAGRQPIATGGTDAYNRLAQFPEAEIEDFDEEHPSGGDSARNELFRRALELIRQDFTERTWQAFWEIVVEGKTPKEVGEDLSMRPGTIRVAKSRVLHRLRQQLGDILD